MRLFTTGTSVVDRSDIVPSGPLMRHRLGLVALRKVRYVRRFFPELDDLSLRIGLTRAAAGLADLEHQTLWLNPNRLSLHTIAHELVHLLQARGLVPGGERSCDLFALARDVTLVDAMPYYLRLPRELGDGGGWLRPGFARPLHGMACEAVTLRASGHRRYILWFEDEVRGQLAGERAERQPGQRSPGGSRRRAQPLLLFK
jgi:hypothetical protein